MLVRSAPQYSGNSGPPPRSYTHQKSADSRADGHLFTSPTVFWVFEPLPIAAGSCQAAIDYHDNLSPFVWIVQEITDTPRYGHRPEASVTFSTNVKFDRTTPLGADSARKSLCGQKTKGPCRFVVKYRSTSRRLRIPKTAVRTKTDRSGFQQREIAIVEGSS